MFIVLFGERTPAYYRNAHGAVIIGVHQIKQSERHVVVVQRARVAVAPEWQLRISGHGQGAAHERDGLDSGDAFELREHCAVFCAKLIRRCVWIGSGGNQKSKYIVRIETGIDVPER